jgi:HEAT repeat protein
MRMVRSAGPVGAEEVLLAGLADADPQVMEEAIRGLGEFADRLSAESALRITRSLAPIIEQRGLWRSGLKVRLAAIEALGCLAREEGVPALARALRERGWFLPRRHEAVRRAAARSLESIPCLAAGAALQEGATSGSPSTAGACHAAWARWTARHGDGAAVEDE